MKYILLLIMTMLSVYSASEEVSDFTKVKEWWKKRPLKRLGFWLAIFLCAWTIVCTWNDDNDAERDKAALNKSVQRAESQLQEANSLIQSQTELLKKQEQSMFEQSRIIGSISFNTLFTDCEDMAILKIWLFRTPADAISAWLVTLRRWPDCASPTARTVREVPISSAA